MKTLTVENFETVFDLLDGFDPFYHMSDDQRVWKTHLHMHKKIIEECDMLGVSTEFAMAAHMFVAPLRGKAPRQFFSDALGQAQAFRLPRREDQKYSETATK